MLTKECNFLDGCFIITHFPKYVDMDVSHYSLFFFSQLLLGKKPAEKGKKNESEFRRSSIKSLYLFRLVWCAGNKNGI